MLWLLVACHGGETTPNGGTTGDAIPDPYEGLDGTACEQGTFVTNTATAWFVGDLQIDGDSFSGTETAAVHWSANWLDVCGYAPDCRVVWALSGSVGDPISCSTCDYGLDVTATLDDAASDCPDLHRTDFGDSQWTASYDVKLNDDGTTDVSFGESGTALGGWHWAGSRVTYVSDAALCNPYPDSLESICE